MFFLIALLPANRGFTSSGPLPDLRHDKTAFGSFWHGALSSLDEIPPAYRMSAEGTVEFVASRGETRLAFHNLPAEDAVCVVIRITDAVLSEPPKAAAGCLEFVFPWRQGMTADKAGQEASQHMLCRGVLDACRLVKIALGQGNRPFASVGLIGDGYGAGIALGVAALMPENVAFVVAHQPICLTPELYAECEEETWNAQGVAEARRLEPLLNAARFAPFVLAPTLVLAGEWDTLATPESCQRLWAALGRRGTLWMVPETGHCLPGELSDWDGLWKRWAFVSPDQAA